MKITQTVKVGDMYKVYCDPTVSSPIFFLTKLAYRMKIFCPSINLKISFEKPCICIEKIEGRNALWYCIKKNGSAKQENIFHIIDHIFTIYEPLIIPTDRGDIYYPVHADCHPGNIIITDENVPHILDPYQYRYFEEVWHEGPLFDAVVFLIGLNTVSFEAFNLAISYLKYKSRLEEGVFRQKIKAILLNLELRYEKIKKTTAKDREILSKVLTTIKTIQGTGYKW